MSILKVLDKDIITARKAKDSELLTKLSYFKSILVENSKSKSPIGEIEALKSYGKKLIKSLNDFAGNEFACRKIYEEAELLRSYLPAELTHDGISAYIEAKLPEIEDKSFKNVMSVICKDLKGKADNAIISKLLREYLKGEDL